MEEFAYSRCASRLSEMQSRDYLIQAASSHPKSIRGKDYLCQFSSSTSDVDVLTSSAAAALFIHYDVDASGAWEPEEFKLFLEDLKEVCGEARSVSHDEISKFRKAVSRDTGTNASDKVWRADFEQYAVGRSLDLGFGNL